MAVWEEAQGVRDPLLLAYEERLRRLRRDPKTIQMFRQTARKFQALLDDLGASAVDVQSWAIEEWLETLPLARSTKEGHLKRIRWAYTYGITREVTTRNPTLDVKLPHEPDKEPVIVPNPALREMKERIADDRRWAMFHLLAYAGLRRAEVIQRDWKDVDFKTSTLTVLGKQGKLRKVPIHPALAEALQSLKQREGPIIVPARNGKAIGDDTWDALLKSFTEGEYTAHDFRRTVASSLFMNGVATDSIDRIMGWSPRAVRSRFYIRHAPESLQRAILRLYADDPV